MRRLIDLVWLVNVGLGILTISLGVVGALFSLYQLFI